MSDLGLTKEFEKMDAHQLQHLLSLMCTGKTFSLRVPGGKININAENVSITPQGIDQDKPDSNNFKDCENYKEGVDNKNDIAKDTPRKSKSTIEQLVKSSERINPDYSPNIFPCTRCCVYFDINSSPYDCLLHPGQLTTNVTDAIWANHDVVKYGAIEDLVHDPSFEDRWVWSCCGELGSDAGCKGTKHMVPKEYGELENSSGDSSESEDFEDIPGDLSTELEEIEASLSQRVENGCNNGVEEGRRY